MESKEFELLLRIYNKSSYKEQDYNVKYLEDNRFVYRKNGFINLTEKAKEFIQRQSKEHYDTQDILNYTDFPTKVELLSDLRVAVGCERLMNKFFSQARENRRKLDDYNSASKSSK